MYIEPDVVVAAAGAGMSPADAAGRRQLEVLGELIRKQRQQAELTLRELAERTNVSNPYLSQIERGLHEPSVRVLKAIAGALNLSAESLLVQAGVLDGTDATDAAGHRGGGGQRRPPPERRPAGGPAERLPELRRGRPAEAQQARAQAVLSAQERRSGGKGAPLDCTEPTRGSVRDAEAPSGCDDGECLAARGSGGLDDLLGRGVAGHRRHGLEDGE